MAIAASAHADRKSIGHLSSQEVDRISQVELLIDLYNAKIQRAEADPKLNDEARDRKVQALQHLMEQEIAALSQVE